MQREGEIGDECIGGGRLPSAHFLPSGYSAPFPALLWFCRDFEGLSPHLSALPTVVPPDGQSETHLAARQLASRDLRTLLPMASFDPILFWHLCTLPIRSRGTTRGVARPPSPRRRKTVPAFPKMEMSENKKSHSSVNRPPKGFKKLHCFGASGRTNEPREEVRAAQR